MTGLLRSEGRLFSVPTKHRGLVSTSRIRSSRPNKEARLVQLALDRRDVLSVLNGID
jgi:hypothetical protein